MANIKTLGRLKHEKSINLLRNPQNSGVESSFYIPPKIGNFSNVSFQLKISQFLGVCKQWIQSKRCFVDSKEMWLIFCVFSLPGVLMFLIMTQTATGNHNLMLDLHYVHHFISVHVLRFSCCLHLVQHFWSHLMRTVYLMFNSMERL